MQYFISEVVYKFKRKILLKSVCGEFVQLRVQDPWPDKPTLPVASFNVYSKRKFSKTTRLQTATIPYCFQQGFEGIFCQNTAKRINCRHQSIANSQKKAVHCLRKLFREKGSSDVICMRAIALVKRFKRNCNNSDGKNFIKALRLNEFYQRWFIKKIMNVLVASIQRKSNINGGKESRERPRKMIEHCWISCISANTARKLNTSVSNQQELWLQLSVNNSVALAWPQICVV